MWRHILREGVSYYDTWRSAGSGCKGFGGIRYQFCFFPWKKVSLKNKTKFFHKLKIVSRVIFCNIFTDCVFFQGYNFRKFWRASSLGSWFFSKFLTRYSKNHGLLSTAFLFPENSRSCCVRRVFFSRWRTVGKLQKYTGGFRRKSAKYEMPYPKKKFHKDRRYNWWSTQTTASPTKLEVQTTADYRWERPPGANKANTCRLCHRQRKAYDFTLASSFSVVSTIHRGSCVCRGARRLGGSKLTGWERWEIQPTPSPQFLILMLKWSYCKIRVVYSIFLGIAELTLSFLYL